MARREIKNMKKILKSDMKKKNLNRFNQDFYLEFPNAVNYLEKQATEGNFTILVEKFSKICGNVQIEIKSDIITLEKI